MADDTTDDTNGSKLYSLLKHPVVSAVIISVVMNMAGQYVSQVRIEEKMNSMQREIDSLATLNSKRMEIAFGMVRDLEARVDIIRFEQGKNSGTIENILKTHEVYNRYIPDWWKDKNKQQKK